MALIEFTDKGLYCSAGGFYIDPWKPVDRALITHGHSDHARWGSHSYLCHHITKAILEHRLGPGQYQGIDWNQNLYINGVRVGFFPAGHIAGSSQIRLEYQGQVSVVSGDYKLENDGLSGVFEPLKCHQFITESTFGLPVYKWKPQQMVYREMQQWILRNMEAGRTSVVIAYSLGKAQRILEPLTQVTDRIFAHGAVHRMHLALQQAGVPLPAISRVTGETRAAELKGSVVIAPPGAEGTTWMKKFGNYETGICSGWMQVRGNIRRKNADAAFVISDHADWEGLIAACRATQAECVDVTHGFQAVFSRYLNSIGIPSREVHTEFGTETEEPFPGDAIIQS